MVIELFCAATVLLLLSGVPGLMTSRSCCTGERVSAVMVVAGSLLGVGAALASFGASPVIFTAPWSVPGGGVLLRIDPLAALFLLPVYLVGAFGTIYALGYWSQREQPATGGRMRLFYGLLVGAMTLVVTAAHGLLFLVAWEVMALSGFFLITTEEMKEEVRRAGYIYLAATHTGTLALFALFTLLGEGTGSFAFPAAGALALPHLATPIFLLALFGFGLKAGIMPLHIWLPGAHAAAPSHVSALLSGVMLKMGIYGIVRLTSFFADIPPWWGVTLLLLGIISGVIGVAFAIAQHDLKRLLAYHSVENIGIIAIGLGVALLGRSYGLPLLTALGLAGALLHVINHSLFKSLLFLGAGAVVHATGTREIDHLGGLLGSMPRTALLFLGGAVAISGLPPLNGFVSEWLIYLGIFNSLESGTLAVRLTALAAPALALIGALALACFVKVFGAVFLGTPRSAAVSGAHEAPLSMLLPMGGLLGACVFIGLWPAALYPALSGAVACWSGGADSVGPLLADSAPPGALSATGVILFGLLLGGIFFLKRRGRGAAGAATWGCGYARPVPRAQYTASSLAEMLLSLFRWGLLPREEGGKVQGVFPRKASFATHTPDAVLDRLLLPLCRGAARGCTWSRAVVQRGSTCFYLLYVALTLGVLLTLSTLLGG